MFVLREHPNLFTVGALCCKWLLIQIGALCQFPPHPTSICIRAVSILPPTKRASLFLGSSQGKLCAKWELQQFNGYTDLEISAQPDEGQPRWPSPATSLPQCSHHQRGRRTHILPTFCRITLLT